MFSQLFYLESWYFFMSFADRLKILRKINHVTQKEVADFLEIKETAYSRYERLTTNPTLKTLNSLAEYFNVSIDYLIGKEEINTSEIKTIYSNLSINRQTNVLNYAKKELEEQQSEINNSCQRKVGIFLKNFRLKQLRIEKGIKQTELAKMFDITLRNYQYWETSERSPKIDDLIKLAEYFNVSVDYLLGIDDIPNRKKL